MRGIVSHPDDVRVDLITNRRGRTIEVHVNPEDLGKVIGRKGLFYELVGNQIGAIDGPTEYSVYPSNVSAKLAPKDSDGVAARLSAAIRARVPEAYRDTFGGTVVMDANDIGRDVLGSDVSPRDHERFAAMFADNPLGQGSQQTPMAIVFVQD